MTEIIEFEKEYYLQTITNGHLSELFDLKLITAEFQFHDFRLDGLAYDEKEKAFVIIEYKNKIDFEVLNQSETYYNLLQDNRQIYIDRFNEEFNTCLSEEDFDFKKAKVMIIGPKFTKEQIKRSENPEYPFELYRATLYKCDGKNGFITYRQINGDFNKRLDIKLDELKITEEMLLEGKSPEMLDLYNDLKNRVLNEYDDVSIKYMVDQFSFKAGNNLICVVVFLKSSFNIFLYGENLDDAEKAVNICEKSTGGNANYKLKCKPDDIDYFMNLFRQVYEQKCDNMKVCPACSTKNNTKEEYCLNCGQKLIEDDQKDEILNDKLQIPKDKIILLDLNYTLISNSWAIRYEKLPEKISKRKYEHELVDLIKDNYVILITASPDYTSEDSLKHIKENTDLNINESYWNFGKRPHELKKYWLEKEVMPKHGYDPDRYLAIESNPKTRAMYESFGIEARPKGDFI